MKKLTIIGIMAAGALLFASCDKDPKGPVCTDFGELVSFGFYQADNQKTTPAASEGEEPTVENLLSRDYVAKVSSSMMFILSSEEYANTAIKARYEIKKDNIIKVNGTKVESQAPSDPEVESTTLSGSFTFDPSSPIDIIVTNTKSNRSTAYTVNFGEINISFTKIGDYKESKTVHDDFFKVVVNSGNAYISYARTDTSVTSSKNHASVIKWTGSNSFELVGAGGFSGAATDARIYYPMLTFDNNNTPYVAFYDYKLKKGRVMTFNGTVWENVGDDKGFGVTALTANYNVPVVFCNPANNNPVALYSGGGKKEDYYRTAFVGTFNGSTWDVAALANAPTVDGGENMYYQSKTVQIGNTVYMFSAFNGTAENAGGFYVYKYENGAFSLLGKNFVSTSHGGCISFKADAEGNLYALVSEKSGGKTEYELALYSVSKEDGSMTAISGPIAKMDNTHTVQSNFIIDGENTYVIFRDLNDELMKFGFITNTGEWSYFMPIANVPTGTAQPDLVKIGSDIYAVFNSYTKDGNTNRYHLTFYKMVKN